VCNTHTQLEENNVFILPLTNTFMSLWRDTVHATEVRPVGCQPPPPGENNLPRSLLPFCYGRTKSGEDFVGKLLLILSDPEGVVLTLTDPRMAAKKGGYDLEVLSVGFVGPRHATWLLLNKKIMSGVLLKTNCCDTSQS